ncbi:hypothetical protein OM076_38835 [Solirubrobacter ginsenosidimutans]|uniref:Uncharacterized protein n=1 Tax=Solirubrobacter ginsenosidimutans TaxID=490573 RepID=A0A9X3N2Y3_9ACTN|nr:hypothetical protein [Solirubrobacter ginsenosidimutans]MDA0166286.1 hypothetical protein [Solirubrobacter ginsenosidimutans]
MSAIKRADAGAAISGLFGTSSATGGLARRASEPAARVEATPTHREQRLRQGVELDERDVEFLRSLSRPRRTGQPRTLGSKFVATGVLAAAIELLREREIDMDGVEAGDLTEMTARARSALQGDSRSPDPRESER